MTDNPDLSGLAKQHRNLEGYAEKMAAAALGEGAQITHYRERYRAPTSAPEPAVPSKPLITVRGGLGGKGALLEVPIADTRRNVRYGAISG